MRVALVTNYLTDYRVPLYERLARSDGLEVLCFGGGGRYVPAWFSDLDAQLAAAPFPARRISGPRDAFAAGASGRYDAVIAPFAGGAMLPAAYAGAAVRGVPFVLWASVWSEPRSAAHAIARPAVHHIYRHAAAVVAYGEHVRRFVAGIRGRDEDVFVAPQSVEPELFGRAVAPGEIAAFRAEHALGAGPLVLYVGRLVAEKGIGVLRDAWPQVGGSATLVVAGDGPMRGAVASLPGARVLGPLPRAALPVAYAAAAVTAVPSIPTARFREPWGLVCNESAHQGTPVIATAAVGAAAGGLIRDGETGLVVAPGDAGALAAALDALLADPALAARLGARARTEVELDYTYDAMADAFTRALGVALSRRHR